MPNTSVAIINASTVLRDDDVAAVVPALQKQVSEHLSAVWGIDATLNFVQQGASPPAGTWWLTILDNSDQAGSLGYHDLTNEGLPLGRVFAGSDMVNGNNWTVTASHELLEMLIDPDINRAVFIQDETGAGKLYAYEICDLCESDQYGYQIDEVLVSDFLFPSWFESFRTPGSAQFDVMQHITQPFELLAGGYINTYDVGAGRGGWQPLNAAATPQNHLARGPVGSRRERRRLRRDHWLRSVF